MSKKAETKKAEKDIKRAMFNDQMLEAKQRADEKYPKVLIAIPTYNKKEYCLPEFLKALENLTYPNYDVIFCDTSPGNDYFEKLKGMGLNVLKSNFNNIDSRLNLRDGRNILRMHFLTHDYDYYFSLEDDNIPPKDIIQRLLEVNEDVVGGWYTFRNEYPSVILGNPYNTGFRANIPLWEKTPSVFKCFSMGLGCVLIKKYVIEKFKFKVEQASHNGEDLHWNDDIFFYLNCDDVQIKCYCVKNLQIPHIVRAGKTI